jgi:hypothetical protein
MKVSIVSKNVSLWDQSCCYYMPAIRVNYRCSDSKFRGTKCVIVLKSNYCSGYVIIVIGQQVRIVCSVRIEVCSRLALFICYFNMYTFVLVTIIYFLYITHKCAIND